MIPDPVQAWAALLEASALADAVRTRPWLYPAANLIHVLGVALLVGAICALDLRLLGAFRRAVSAAGAATLLVPVAAAGAVLSVPSGVALFVVEASPLTAHPLMQAKIGLLVLGLGNAVLFHRLWKQRLPAWDDGIPAAARIQAVASLAIWIGALACGRLIAYV